MRHVYFQTFLTVSMIRNEVWDGIGKSCTYLFQQSRFCFMDWSSRLTVHRETKQIHTFVILLLVSTNEIKCHTLLQNMKQFLFHAIYLVTMKNEKKNTFCPCVTNFHLAESPALDKGGNFI